MKRRSGDNLNTSRYGRVSSKKKFSEEFATFLYEPAKTVVNNVSKKNKSNSNKMNCNIRNSKVNGFNIGDIILAKVGKYPVWPGIIVNDPESNMFSKSKLVNLSLYILIEQFTF